MCIRDRPPALPSPLYINVTPQDDFSGAQVTLRAVPHGFPLDQAQSTELGYQPETSVYYTQLEVDRAGDWELDVQVSGPRGTGRARIPFSISVAQLAPNTAPNPELISDPQPAGASARSTSAS